VSYISIIILAFALSIDSMIVSFSYGLNFPSERLKNATLLALFTGGFQGLMPAIGYFLTNGVKSSISTYADWIVFFIFTYLGLKFILEAFQKEQKKELCIGIKCLLLVGIATSIDAFSAGISLSLYGNKILKPAILIALVTFINSTLGFYIGGKFRNLPSKFLQILGGILLIFLGVKVFL